MQQWKQEEQWPQAAALVLRFFSLTLGFTSYIERRSPEYG